TVAGVGHRNTQAEGRRTMQLLGPTSVGRRYVLGIAGIVGVTLFVGCKSDPPAIPGCAATPGEAGCEDPTGGPPPTPSCADPDFEGAHPPATEYTCEGQAGGAIVYNQVILEIAGEDRGGPGFIEPDPPVTDFPASADVSSCCYGLDPAQQQADEEAVFDAC